MKKSLIAAVSVVFSMCLTLTAQTVSAKSHTVFNGKIFEGKVGTALVLLSKSDTPIHIGDGQGMISDIDPFTPNPPVAFGWTFTLDKPPAEGKLTITIYSLGPSEYNCDTSVSLNGKTVSQLDTFGGDSWKTTLAEISLQYSHFNTALNKLIIKESRCARAGMNDSIIKEVVIETY